MDQSINYSQFFAHYRLQESLAWYLKRALFYNSALLLVLFDFLNKLVHFGKGGYTIECCYSGVKQTICDTYKIPALPIETYWIIKEIYIKQY